MKKNNSRRQFLRVAGAGALGLALQTLSRAGWRSDLSARELFVYVGTYTASPNSHSEGIYICRLDLSSGKLRRADVAKGVVNPSFLAIDRRRQFLYAVNEVTTFGGKPSGAVSSFSIDQKTGALKFLNQRSSSGSGPCHLTIDGSGKFVLVANYDAGSIAVLPLRAGTLGAPADMVQHHGSSINPERQEGPHAHGVVLDKDNRFVFVPDLGLDKIMIYKFDSRNGKLSANDEPAAKLKPGAGPRHFTFHHNGRWAYVINELDSTITAFAYDGARGILKQAQTISTLPAGFSGKNSCAEIEVAAAGKFLYGSNRGHDSIVVFSIDQETGKLALVQHVSSGGKTPRNFAIDPTGGFLLAANQNSDSVVSLRIDALSGKLSSTGQAVEVPTPVCVVMSDKL
jgi:6-phosphogluconolactonase